MSPQRPAGTVVPLRLASQLLGGRPGRSAEEVVDRLLAVQAQDPRGFRLAARSRSSGLSASDVNRALNERSLIVTWLNRGTLHLVRADDYWLLHPLTTPQLAKGSKRRLQQEGVSLRQAERGVSVVVDATSEGPQTRQQLRRRLDAAGVPTAGQATVHVLMAASLRGHVVRGPMIGNDQAYVAVPDWLPPPPPPLERREVLAELARRYLAGHAPAAAEDMAKWAGITLGDARRGFDAIADDVEPFAGGLVVLADGGRTAALPPPLLLGPYDPLLHGWASREPFVGQHANVVTSNGLFRPFALVDGRVVATWSLPSGVVTIKPLERIAPGVRKALVEDARDVLRFLELPDRPVVFEETEQA